MIRLTLWTGARHLEPSAYLRRRLHWRSSKRTAISQKCGTRIVLGLIRVYVTRPKKRLRASTKHTNCSKVGRLVVAAGRRRLVQNHLRLRRRVERRPPTNLLRRDKRRSGKRRG